MEVRQSTDSDAYVCARIEELIQANIFSVREAAEVMECSRWGLYRLLKQGKSPSVTQLHKLSGYLELPMSYWFTDSVHTSVSVQSTPRLTKTIVQAINKLSPVDQAELLQLLNQSVDTLCDALVIARVLLALPKERRQLMLKTLKLLCRR